MGDITVSRRPEIESIWISYCPMTLDGCEPHCFGKFTSHHRLATPVSSWARLKSGAGTPPVLTRHGWLIIYHGVSEMSTAHQLCYSAGVMVLFEGASTNHPLSFSGAGADAVAYAGTRRDRSEHGVSHRHRPPPRCRFAGSFRHLLRDRRQPDQRGTPGRAGVIAPWGSYRPAGSKGVMIPGI